MTDKEFQLKMLETRKHHKAYLASLKTLENEYWRRFGNFPSEVDDDFWIDTFSNSASARINFEEIIESAKERNQ